MEPPIVELYRELLQTRDEQKKVHSQSFLRKTSRDKIFRHYTNRISELSELIEIEAERKI